MSQMAHHHADREQVHTPPEGLGGLLTSGAEQAESVAAWLRWHAVELVGVGVPVALALAVSAWFLAFVIPAAGLWAYHETSHARRRAKLRSAERAALTSNDAEELDQ